MWDLILKGLAWFSKKDNRDKVVKGIETAGKVAEKVNEVLEKKEVAGLGK